jgi:hypothetical protein
MDRIFRPKREEAKVEWGKLNNEEVQVDSEGL